MIAAWYSAALCRGLIEACCRRNICLRSGSIPRLYAAASLKLAELKSEGGALSGIPRLYAAASLKPVASVGRSRILDRIPRLYAAASLKLSREYQRASSSRSYSAALCRGLIEAVLS